MRPKTYLVLFFCLAVSMPILQSCSNTRSNVGISVEEGYKSINGTEIYYKKMGEGEPVIVIHGGPVLEHGYLVPYLKPLAEDYELIFFDQRLSGHSSGEVDSSEVRLQYFIDDIEELRKSFNVDKIHLLAHSWGGFLAMNYAIEYPGNLQSLILLNSMPPSYEMWMEEEQALAQKVSKEDSMKRQEILSSDRFETDQPQAIEDLLILSFKNQFVDPSLADSLDFYIPGDYMLRSQLFGNLMVDLTNYDLQVELSTLEVPTLIMYGEIEPSVSISAPALLDTIPNSELVIIENAGHFPFVEQQERFMDEVHTFLESVD